MKKTALRLPLTLFLLLGHTVAATAQEAPPPRFYGQEQAVQMRQLTVEERDRRRAEHLQRQQQRDAWRQMSPEERQQLRSDIRDAGRSLYPHRARLRDGRR